MLTPVTDTNELGHRRTPTDGSSDEAQLTDVSRRYAGALRALHVGLPLRAPILPRAYFIAPGSFLCGVWSAERGALGVEEGLFDPGRGERSGGGVGRRGFGIAAKAA